MQNLNSHQMSIITNLAFTTEAKFSELNTEKLPTDHFNYHIRTLCENEFIEKLENNKYKLTTKGKIYLSKLDIFAKEVEKQPKTSVVAICIREHEGKVEYLMHQRKKQPYYDWIIFPGGKSKYGSYLKEEVIRELYEETGIIGKNPELKLINHSINNLEGTSEIIDDIVFYFFVIKEFDGEIISKTIEGENVWMEKENIIKDKNMFPSVIVSLPYLEKSGIHFIEQRLEIVKY